MSSLLIRSCIMNPYMIWHDAFYRFVKIDDPNALVGTLDNLCHEAGVLGSILVASEGINGMLEGTDARTTLQFP
jgi:predicted sulfurtransferase